LPRRRNEHEHEASEDKAQQQVYADVWHGMEPDAVTCRGIRSSGRRPAQQACR
jgi:hypothetical protein